MDGVLLFLFFSFHFVLMQINATTEMSQMKCFYERLLVTNCLKIQKLFFYSFLLCVDTTLVHPLLYARMIYRLDL